MKIKISIKYNPTVSELNRYQKFADKNWGKQDKSAEELKDNFFNKPKIVILAYSENQLMGLLNIHLKQGKIGSKIFSIGGIGGVVTQKEFRHRGIATKILQKAKKILKVKDLDMAMLNTNIPKFGGLYKKIGFVPLGKPYYFFSKSGKEKVENSGMIMPIKSQKIFNNILSTKEKINVGRSNF